MKYKVGDRFYVKKYNSHGTIIAIDGQMGLIDWDKTKFSWGINKPPNSWINLKTKKTPKAVSFAAELTRAFWK